MNTDNSVKKQNATCDNNVLVGGFSEEDELQAVFLIQAVSESTFNNRRRKLQEITGFSDGGCGSYEEDNECGVWRIIVTGYFNDLEELKLVIKKMEKYKWLFLSDSHILFEDDYLFSSGKWLV
jgi:hypothetical protein